MNENPYMMLAKVILPSEMTEYFDLVKVRTDEYSGEPRLHLYLDEKDKAPDARTDLSPNGFYEITNQLPFLRPFSRFKRPYCWRRPMLYFTPSSVILPRAAATSCLVAVGCAFR